MAAASEKIERKLAALDERIRDVLTRPDDDPLWRDEAFWNGRWQAMVDQFAAMTEEAVALARKERKLAGG